MFLLPVNKKHVVILGAGFAGLELATRLSESLAEGAHHAAPSPFR
jgi:NADH dehydrogenase FAD-containing subunit